MNLVANPSDPPEDDDPDRAPCCGSARAGGTEVSLEELLRIGERDHAASPRRPERRAWLGRAAAITRSAVKRPVLAVVSVASAMALALVFINRLAPQAMPEVCSTMMLVLATEFVLLVRQRRSLTAVAG